MVYWTVATTIDDILESTRREPVQSSTLKQLKHIRMELYLKIDQNDSLVNGKWLSDCHIVT